MARRPKPALRRLPPELADLKGWLDFVERELQRLDGVDEGFTANIAELAIATALIDATVDDHETRIDALEASSGGSSAQADFGTYHSPVAAWLFSSDPTTDRTGNGHTLTPRGTLPAHVPTYVAGLPCVEFDSAQGYTCSDLALNITGAWSGELVACIRAATATVTPVGWYGSGETEDVNMTWALMRTSGTASSKGTLGGLLWETGAGSDINSGTALGFIPFYTWHHLVQTRSSSGVFKTYVNGALLSTIGPLTMPTGGAGGQLVIQPNTAGGGSWDGLYLAIYDTELTDSQVLELAKKRLAINEAA